MTVWSWIGQLFGTVFVTSGLALWLVQKYGDLWFRERFDKRALEHQSALAAELEMLKGRVAGLSTSVIKVRTIEIDLLLKLWGLTERSFNLTVSAATAGSFGPDFTKYTELQLINLMDDLEYKPWQKEKMLAASDTEQQNLYHEFAQRHTRVLMQKFNRELNECFCEMVVVMPPGLVNKYKAYIDLVYTIQIKVMMGRDGHVEDLSDHPYMMTTEKLRPIKDELELVVRRRFAELTDQHHDPTPTEDQSMVPAAVGTRSPQENSSTT